MRLRSAKLVCAHSAWTARARSIAARTSSGPHFGTVPSGLPVNGCSISIGSLPAVETTRAARRSSCCGVTRFDGSSTAGLGVVVSAVMVDMAPILSGLSGDRLRAACARYRSRRRRQADREDRSAAIRVRGLHAPTVRLDDRRDDREAEARPAAPALAPGIGAPEALEQ